VSQHRGMTLLWRATRSAIAFATLLLTTLPSTVSADPGDVLTPFGTKLWADGATVDYKFHADVPTWLRTVLGDVLEVGWADTDTNNSDGPRYNGPVTSGEDLKLFWDTQSGISECDDDAPGWLGCATAEETPMQIWIRKDPAGQNAYGDDQWCDLSETGACPWAGRIAIHEVGHVAGHLGHYAANNWGRSRMTPLPPLRGEAESDDAIVLGRCDEARMQKVYDVSSTWGGFRKCWDEVASVNSDGTLKTKVTASPNITSACSGDPITLSGRLSIEVFGSYGEISDNNLGLRQLHIYRNSQSYSSTSTGTGSTGNNWSKTFTFTVSSTTSYTFQARSHPWRMRSETTIPAPTL